MIFPKSLLITFVVFLLLLLAVTVLGIVEGNPVTFLGSYVFGAVGVLLGALVAWKFLETLADVVISLLVCLAPIIAIALVNISGLHLLLAGPIAGLFVAFVTFPLLPHAKAYSKLIRYKAE